ncbi:MAG: integrase core domain-containing protein [Bifidobacterium sp.]
MAALDQAITWSSRHGNPQGLIHHSDHGVQYISTLYSTHLTEAGIQASTGTVGDSHDNALAETLNGAYKTELIKRVQPFDTVETLQQATFDWASWWNTERLHEYLHHHTPAEAEAEYYQQQAVQTVVKNQQTSMNKNQSTSNNARKNNETTHKNSTNNVSNPPCWRRCCPLFVLGFEVDWFLFYPIQLLLKRPIRRPIKSVSNHLKPLYAYSRKPEESALLQQKTPFRKEWRFHSGGAAGN